MNQFLIVHGREAAQRDLLLERGIALFERLSGLPCSGRFNAGITGIALFPLHARPAAGIQKIAEAWGFASGTLFACGQGGPGAVEELLQLGLGPDAPSSSLLERVEGLFALVAGGPGGSFTLHTDRLGNLHVYESRQDGCVALSNSSLLLAALGRADFDPHACRQFLAMGTVFGSRSLFEGVRKLGPARCFRYAEGELASEHIYWDIRSRFHDRAGFTGSVPTMAASLVAAMDSITSAYPRPLLDLTGGYDSRCVLAAMLETGRPFTAVVNGPEDSGDVRTAKRIAREFGLRLIHNPRRELSASDCGFVQNCLGLTDGEVDVTQYWSTARIHRQSAAEHGISLNGSNGEITKGYWYELLFPHIGARGHFDSRSVAARRFTFSGEAAGLLAHDFPESLTQEMAGLIDEANRGLEDYPNTASLDNVYVSLRMHRWQGRISSSTQRIWPGSSPFMFRQPMEIALATPGTQRARLKFTTRLIEKLNPRLAALPLEAGYPALPLRWNNAHRFALPVAREYAEKAASKLASRSRVAAVLLGRGQSGNRPPHWLSLPELSAWLEPDAMQTRALYSPAALRSLLDEAHLGRNPAAQRAGRILTLELAARAVRGLEGASRQG